jgi:hypothetical protein
MPPALPQNFRLLPRQNSFAPVPSSYGSASSSPHPGVVAGIVIGSVGGFLLLLFLIYSCLGFGPQLWVQPSRSEYTAASQSVLSFRTRRTSRARSARRPSRAGGARVTETYEVRTRESRGGGRTRSGVRPVVVGEPVVVEPTRAPPPPRVVRSEDSEDDDEEDEIVVLEEHSPPRRKHRRESSGRRSEERYSRGGGSYYHDAEPGSPSYRERRDRRYSRDR